VSIPERGGACSSRCRSRPPVSRFFAATASAVVPDGAREQLKSVDLVPGLATRALAEARDPLRPSTERAVSDRTTSDVLCRSPSASARSPPRVRPAQPVFRQAVQLTRRARALQGRHPVRGDGTKNPERLRCVGCPTLRSNRALRVGLFGFRASLRTLSPDPAMPSPSRECGWLVLPRARSTRPLDLAIADVRKMRPHSPLQPT
jgi:hypothetical protein